MQTPRLDTSGCLPRKNLTEGNVGLTQAYDLRDLAVQEAFALRDATGSELKERLARAKAIQAYGTLWREASDRIRILRGRPLPGSLKPERKVKSKAKPIPPPTLEP